MRRRTQYPGRTELRPVLALAARAAVSFGGSWAPERGARARWVQEVVPPAAVGWTAQYRSSPCAAALRREVGKGMWKLRVSGKRQPWPSPSKGLCLSGYPSLWDPWRVDRSLPLPDCILTSSVCSLVEARLLRSPWSGSRLRAESSNATPLRVRCDFLFRVQGIRSHFRGNGI